MTARVAIGLDDSIDVMIERMAEGNIGALSVVIRLMNDIPSGDGLDALLVLDDMNMRGGQLWRAFKDHCGGDIARLVAEVNARSQAMVDAVNAGDDGTGEKAVVSGASFTRSRS